MKYLGLGNVSAAEIRRAHAVHPITAVRYEYSLWGREAEQELPPTLRELGIALENIPRFSSANLASNLDRFAPLIELADELGITPAQRALAWLLHQGNDIFPLPGTRKLARIDENAPSLDISLDQSTLDRIFELAQPGLATGATLL